MDSSHGAYTQDTFHSSFCAVWIVFYRSKRWVFFIVLVVFWCRAMAKDAKACFSLARFNESYLCKMVRSFVALCFIILLLFYYSVFHVISLVSYQHRFYFEKSVIKWILCVLFMESARVLNPSWTETDAIPNQNIGHQAKVPIMIPTQSNQFNAVFSQYRGLDIKY